MKNPAALLPKTLLAIPLVGLLAACSPSMESVDLPTSVVEASVLSPSALGITFEVTNPRGADMEDVTCVPSAFVGGNDVSTFMSGGTLPSLDAGQTERHSLTVEIKEQQAAYVTRAEMYCSGRAPVGE